MPNAGQPDHPADPAAAPVLLLASELKDLRQRSGLTLRQLAEITHLAISTLSTAAGGKKTPSWPVTRALALACGGDETRIRELWEAAAVQEGRLVHDMPSGDPPDPRSAQSTEDYLNLLRQLRSWAQIALTQLNERSGGYLPRSTVSETLNRGKLPSLRFVTTFTTACGLNADQIHRWEQTLDDLKSQEIEHAETVAPQREQDPQPAPADRRRVARQLRGLVGVVEAEMDWVPQDRPRYTAIGASMLLAAVLVSLSGFTALEQSLPRWSWIVLSVNAGAAGIVALFLESVSIGGLHIVEGRRRRFRKVAGYVLSTILVALIAAQSLGLAIMRPEIDGQVMRERVSAQASYEGRLRACNPLLGAPPSCGRFSVLTDAQRLQQTQLADFTMQRQTLQNQAADANKAIAAADDLARLECAGQRGSGLSGKVGQGPNCRHDRQVADLTRLNSHLPNLQLRMEDLDAKIANITRDISAFINQTITNKISASRSHLNDRAGLIEQVSALNTLTVHHLPVAMMLVTLIVGLAGVLTLPMVLISIAAASAYTRRIAALAEAERQRLEARLSIHNLAALTVSIVESVRQLPQPVALPALDETIITLTAAVDQLKELAGQNSRKRGKQQTASGGRRRYPEGPTTNSSS